jgi:uncharacterized Zn finger protein (UPF0148 family)
MEVTMGVYLCKKCGVFRSHGLVCPVCKSQEYEPLDVKVEKVNEMKQKIASSHLEWLISQRKDLKDEVTEIEKDIKAQQVRLNRHLKYIIRNEKDVETFLFKAENNLFKPCKRHNADADNDIQQENGCGYSGRICHKCNSLIIVDSDGLNEPIKIIRTIHPRHPFKPDCTHPIIIDWFTFSKVYKGRNLAPLCKDGVYCLVCGACYEEPGRYSKKVK